MVSGITFFSEVDEYVIGSPVDQQAYDEDDDAENKMPAAQPAHIVSIRWYKLSKVIAICAGIDQIEKYCTHHND